MDPPAWAVGERPPLLSDEPTPVLNSIVGLHNGHQSRKLDRMLQCDNTSGVDIRRIIRKELLQRDWSQRELCRRTGLLPHQMCQYLNDKRDIYAETLQRILDALELQILPASRRRKGR